MASFVPVVRSASLNGYVELARSLGLDAAAMLRRAGLSRRSLDDPETPLSAEAVRRLLELSAQASGVEDFGLRMAAQRQFSNLGPISLVLKEEPTTRHALDTLCRYLRLLNPSLVTRVVEREDLLAIEEEILVQSGAPVRQAMELAVGVMQRILHELLGAQWRPQRVCFKHPAPPDTGRHRAFFGASVEFDAAFNGIVCKAADLDTPRTGANPAIARFARQFLERALVHQHQGTPATVRHLIAALLPGGRCTAQQVAQHLGVDRRTVHRHLALEGESFARLLQSTRSELVLRHLQHGDLPLHEVSALLGFAAPSAFSYWFNTSFGCSVTQWRRSQ